MVRLVEHNGSGADWGAMDELMRAQIKQGTFEDTIVLMHWEPSIVAGSWQDADEIDGDLVRERGFEYSRRHILAGGTAIFSSALPNIMLYYEKPDWSIDETFRANGAAKEAAAAEVGIDAEYDHIGDLEVQREDHRGKIIASAAGNIFGDYWSVTSSMVWGIADGVEVLDDAVDLPEEKFEDKDTDSSVTRIQPITELVEEQGLAVTKDELHRLLARRNVEAVFGEDEPIEETTWTDDEAAFIDEWADFFRSDVWLDRYATSDLQNRWAGEYSLGVAAYKSRKLIKASVVLDHPGRIRDVLFTGDMYAMPQPSVTNPGVLDDIAAAVVGASATDDAAITRRIQQVTDRPEVEIPGIEGDHFARAITRAVDTAEPIGDYRP